MFNLEIRNRQPEWMDEPNLDEALHKHALSGLRRVNYFSRTTGLLFQEMLQLGVGVSGRPLRILDVATGGGDVAIGLAIQARRNGLAVEIDGCDISPTAVALAQTAALKAKLSNVNFMVHDALSFDFSGTYDVVMCSLFLHHLAESETVLVLQRMAAACTRAVLVDDLLRSNWGYALAWWGCRLLTRSPVVHMDGPLSVRAAYTEAEIRRLTDQAGWKVSRFRRHWPQRFLMTWNKSECGDR